MPTAEEASEMKTSGYDWLLHTSAHSCHGSLHKIEPVELTTQMGAGPSAVDGCRGRDGEHLSYGNVAAETFPVAQWLDSA